MDEERKFLHDLANPISTVTLLVDSVMESMNENPALHEEAEHLKKAMDGLSKVASLIQARRQILIQRRQESEKKA